MADNITQANMLFYPLYYDIISLTSLKITHLLLGFAKNPIVSWYFNIRNSVQITEGLDNGDSDNRGSTVLDYATRTQWVERTHGITDKIAYVSKGTKLYLLLLFI